MPNIIYRQHYADNTSRMVRRTTRQGRKPAGLKRWTGRLSTESLAAIEVYAKTLRPYHTVNSIIREAVDKYVRTELMNT